MYRALAVISASACLALATGPAAQAATHTSSHKPAHAPAGRSKAAHAKSGPKSGPKSGHAEAQTSKSAKLRHAADAEAPAKGRKGRGTKVAASGKHRHGGVETADAAPAPRSKHHGKAHDNIEARDEEASAKPSTKKHHGIEAVETAEETAPSKHHGRAAAEEADAPRSRRGHAEDVTPVSGIRGDLRSTKACVAAHVRAHGRPKGSKARLALQRECAKEVEAARRKAEEEAAIRTWSAPRGPLIYPGALPHSASAAPASMPETPANPAPTPAETAAETAGAPAAVPAAAPGGEAKAPASAPAQGEAVVQQTPAPAPAQSGKLFGGLFGHGHRPNPGAPAPTLATLVGADETRLKTELGEPELMRAEGDGALWTYKLPGCALYVFLSREAATAPWKVKGAQTGPLKRGGPAPDVDVCLKSPRS